MTTLRETVDGLTRFAPGTPINLTEVATFLGLEATSAGAVIDTAAAINKEIAFAQRINTDAPLRGEVKLTLRPDGSYVFAGHMSATGFTSHSYRVTVLLRA